MTNTLLITIFALSACSILPEWLGGDADSDKKLPGTRIAVMDEKSSIAVDKFLSQKPVELPLPKENDSFLPGFQAADNLALPEKLTTKTENSAPSSSSREFRLLAAPIAAENKLFVLDGKGVLYAFDAKNIKNILWKNKTTLSENFISGGLAYEKGQVFVILADGQVMGYSANKGAELWRKKFSTPIKSQPVAAKGKLLFITSENELYALSEDGGRTLWNHSGLASSAGILGAASPVIINNLAVVPYSSGEVYGINLDSGKVAWEESLNKKKSTSPQAFALPDINANPVSDERNLYMGSNQAIFVAKELDTGKTLWEKEFSAAKTPWISGSYIYIIDLEDDLMAIERKTGNVRWVIKLSPKKQKETEKTAWNGPIMAGNRLIVTGSGGKMLSISPDDGSILSTTKIIDKVYLSPAIANNALYILNDEGRLAHYR